MKCKNCGHQLSVDGKHYWEIGVKNKMLCCAGSELKTCGCTNPEPETKEVD